MIRKLFPALLFLLLVHWTNAQVWSPWTITSMGDTTMVAVDTLTGHAGGDSLVATYYNYTVGQILDQNSGNSILSLGFCQGSTVRVPGNIDTLGLAAANDLKLQLFYTKNIFLDSEWQSENPDIYFELHQFSDDGTWEKKVYERKFKQLEGIEAMKCVGTFENGIPYYRTFSDSIDVVLGPDQLRDLRLMAYAVGHADTVINQELADQATLPYHQAVDFKVTEKTLHSITLSWFDSSAYAESYDIYRDGEFIDNILSGNTGELRFEDRYDFDSELSLQPGTNYNYKIIARNPGFPHYKDSSLFASQLPASSLDIGLTSEMGSSSFSISWDNTNMQAQYYDRLTLKRGDDIIHESDELTDEFTDELPVYGKVQDYRLLLSKDGNYLVEFDHRSDLFPANGIARGTVLTADRKLPVNAAAVTATTAFPGDTSSVSTQTDKFGRFEIPGIFYGRQSMITVSVNNDTSKIEVWLSENDPVSEMNTIYVSEGIVDTDNAPAVTLLSSVPVDTINVVELNIECDDTQNTLYQLFRNEELLTITESLSFTDDEGLPGMNYRYSVIPFKHLGGKSYLLGDMVDSDVEFPKIIVPDILLTADNAQGFVTIEVHHDAQNLDGIMIYRDSVLWKTTDNPWTGKDMLAEPGKEYEYSAQALRHVGDSTVLSGIIRDYVVYPEIPLCRNLSSSSEDGFLEIAWDFSGNEANYNFDGFRIYRDENLIGFVLKGKHSFYDYHGIPGGSHLYSLSSYLQVEDEVFESGKVSQVFGVPGLSAPHYITASKDEDSDFNDQVLVSWASDYQDTYDGYLIIRDGGENGDESFVIPSPYQESFTDMVNLTDLNYKMGFFENLIKKGNAEVEYKLLAYADHGDTRYYSDTARTTYNFVLQDTSGVFAPVNFRASDYTSGNITLDWEYPEFLTSTFLLYRGSDLIAELPVGTRRYQDIDVETGSKYIYHMQALFDGDSSIFVADAGSISSGLLIHGKVLDQNFQPVVDVKLDLSIYYSDLSQYRNNTLSDESGYFVFPELSLLDFTDIRIKASGVNSQFTTNPVNIGSAGWDGSNIYVEFIDETDYKLRQQTDVATPVKCIGKADEGSGLLFLTWGASNPNFSWFEISRGLRKIGRVEKGQPLILIDSSASPGHIQVYTAQAFLEQPEGNAIGSAIVPFIAEAPFLAPVENLEVIPVDEKNRVEVSWSHPTDNVNGYFIYRNRERLDTITEVPFILLDKSGTPNHSYTYGVTAFWQNSDGTSFESETAEKDCEFPEVFDPTDISLTQKNNSIEVSWECPAENYDGFLVYRDSAVVDTMPSDQFYYRDFGGYAGKYHSFGVSAFRRIGNLVITSRIREKAFVFPELVRVEDITSDSTDRSVTLGWGYGGEEDSLAKAVDGFKIFRDGSPEPIAIVPSGNETVYSFTDQDVDPETAYTYNLIAFRDHALGYFESPAAAVAVSTERLHAPINFVAVPYPDHGYYKLSWDYYDRLDIEKFNIYRDGEGPDFQASVNGTECTYIYTEGSEMGFFIAAVKSGKTSDYVYTGTSGVSRSWTYSISASKGTSTKVKLHLTGVSGGSTYPIHRDGELIATQEIPSGTSEYILYDNDADPGRKYVYSMYQGEPPASADVGWAKPDGVISGFVRTPETAGVPHVTITYSGKYYFADSSYNWLIDTTVTDETGAYAFDRVTYNQSTEYSVKAFRAGHHFREDTKSVILTDSRFQVSCDFTDTSAIILSGTVKHEILEKGWEDVPVILTTLKQGGFQEYDTSRTDEKGFYSFNIEPDNPVVLSYTVNVISDVETHARDYGFVLDTVRFESDTLRKFGPVTTVDFIDTLTSALHISVVTGGGTEIPKPFKFQINSRDYKYEEVLVSELDGEKDLRLPALEYMIDLVGVVNSELDNELYGQYFKGKAEYVDLSPSKLVDADTTIFVYHTPASIEILYTNMDYPPCIGDYVIRQEKYYVIDFGVTEMHGGTEVPVNSGKILIRNGAAAEYLDTVNYNPDGRFESLYFRGGEPELIQPYRKYLHAAFLDDHGQKLGELSFPIVVEGKKSLGGTDIFINPEEYGDHATAHIPLYVLRDPPGDGSSSFIETGVTINRSMELSEEEAYYGGFKTEGQVIFAGVAGAYWEVDLKNGESREESTDYQLSMTSTQRLETSSDALDGQGDKPLVGEQADVVVGMDMLFTYTIQYDLSIRDCEIQRTTIRTYKPTGIKSTWLFTRNQIEAKVREFSNSRDVLVRGNTPPGVDGGSIESLQALADNWQNVIDYLDNSGDPRAWIANYYDHLVDRKAVLETHQEEANAAAIRGFIADRYYYFDLADQLGEIIEAMNTLIDFLDTEPPSEGAGYSTGAELEWYTEAIMKINEFEEADVLDVSRLNTLAKNYFAVKKIYEALLKEGDALYGDLLSYPEPKNYTFGGGTSFESSTENTVSRSTTLTQTFTSENSAGGGYAMELEAAGEVGWWAAYFETKVFTMEAKVGGYGGWDAASSASNSEGRDSTVISGFTLSDDDPGDQFSVNVYPSLDPTQTAYFALVGGRSSCPEEEGTIFRDAPTLSVENPLGEDIVSNLLEGINPAEAAVFPLKIGNLNPFEEDRSYVLSVNPASNRFNATILANGRALGEQTYSVSPLEPIFVDLSISRREGIYEADSIEVTISSDCEGNISESIFLSAFWERPCTPVAITEPVDQWVSNRYNDELLVKVSDFDPDCEVLGSMRLECRKGGSNIWLLIDEISVDSLREFVEATSLIYANPTFIFTWYVNDPEVTWDDGDYQLRVIADCNEFGGGQVFSNVVSGTIDRKNIRLAGPPEPLSGVLTLGGEVKARFTEEVSSFEYRILTGQGVPASGLEMIIDGQEIVLYGADYSWRNQHHGESFTVELLDVEDYWGNSTSNTTDSLITWEFRVWNAPVNVLRNNYEITVPLNGRLEFGDLISNHIACEAAYFGQTATFDVISSTPASLAVEGPESIQLPGHDSMFVTILGNREIGSYQDDITIDNLTIDGNVYSDIVISFLINVVPELAPWEVDESQFESTMNLVANFSLNEELSSDPLDMIAVVINNKLRGVAKIEDAGNENWAAYITAGAMPGEELDGMPIEFWVWDASEGKEYNAYPEEEISFISNTAVGTSIDPVILYIDPVNDLISYHPLHSGWNYVAFTPSALEGDVNDALKSLTASRESVIKTLSDFATYTSEHGWLSASDAFEIHSNLGYMLYITRDDKLRYPGLIQSPDTVVDLRQGWNLIAYPFETPDKLADVLELTSVSTSDLIKGEAPDGELQFSDYSSSAWSGSLTDLHPMFAYMLKAEGAGNPKLIWHPASGEKSGPVAPQKSQDISDAVVDMSRFEKNMTVIAVVDLAGIEGSSSRDSLVVMNGDTLVGRCVLRYRPEFNRYYASFMIYGNRNGDELNAYIYNYDRDIRYDAENHITFVENMTLGSWDIPYTFSAAAPTGVDRNGFSVLGLRAWMDNSASICKVEFYTEKNTECRFGIFDVLGKKIIDVEYHSHTGKNYLEIPMADDRFASGIYFLRSSDANHRTIKLFLH